MPFPTTTFTDPISAQSALMNICTNNGLSGAVEDGNMATLNAAVSNLMQGLPGSTILGVEAVAAGAGITGGTGTLVRTHVTREGGLIITRLFIDLTGLASSTTDLDVIGVSTTPAFLTQITAAVNGTIIGGNMSCLEVPTGGVTDIDLYKSTVGTGKFDDAISGLAGQAAVVTSGGAWTLARVLGTAPDGIAANDYLYLTAGAAGTAATYTAGRYMIMLFGI